MRDLWLMPDVQQTGVIMALEGAQKLPLHEAVSLREVPAAITLGIPEELLLKNREKHFLYAQYARIESGKGVFVCSCRAGKDISNRDIVMTNMQILEINEPPVFPPRLDTLSRSEDGSFLQEVHAAYGFPSNPFANNIMQMLAAVETKPAVATFASERLVNSANKPDWMPKKKHFWHGLRHSQ